MRDYFKMARMLLLLQLAENRRAVRRERLFETVKTLWITVDDFHYSFHVSDTSIYCHRYIPPNSLLFCVFFELSNFDKRTPLFSSNSESHCLRKLAFSLLSLLH